MTELAVIGIDAQFAEQENIDRVERAFYQGGAASCHTLNRDGNMLALCRDSASRLALANGLALADIAVVLLVEEQTVAQRDSLQAYLCDTFLSCSLVSSLGHALDSATELVADHQKAVALIGAQLGTKTVSPPESDSVKATISFDKFFDGYQQVDGIASLLLSSATFSANNASYIYSWIKGYDANSSITQAAKSALTKARVAPEQVTLLEVSALADTSLADKERLGLLDSYSLQKTAAGLHTAISCARSVTGEGHSFSQVAGLLKCVVSLHQRYIPAISDWQTPADTVLEEWQNSPFYFPTDASPWYPHPNGNAHTAAYSCQNKTQYCHLVLQENRLADPAEDLRSNGFFASSDLSLFLLTGDSQQALLAQLEAVEQRVGQASLATIALECFELYKGNSNAIYHAALIAESADELNKEIQLAKAGISNAFLTNVEWKTPKGSYFSPHSVAGENDVAFLYPGIGATYVGLGRDLFHLFPQIYQPVAELADDIGATLKDTLLNPRSISRLGFKQLKQLDINLRYNLASIAECGVGFACVFTKIFEDVFKVKADFSTGYSMGEISMYAALGCWQQPGLMSARLAQSDTFNHRLCGELRTLRAHWDLPDVEDGKIEKIWETYTIKATAEEVAIASAGEDRVYCTIINTPDSLLIAGFPEACERVIKNLGVRAMPLNMANAIHSAPAFKEYAHMEALYTMDVTERIQTKMYSSSCYLPVPQRSKAIANSISKCLCDQVDFPRLVNTLYNKGARVFIEMGPGRSLCSWVDKILKEHEAKPHVSVPVNAKGTSDELTYIRALAKLVSHGVKVELDSLFNGSIVVQKGAH